MTTTKTLFRVGCIDVVREKERKMFAGKSQLIRDEYFLWKGVNLVGGPFETKQEAESKAGEMNAGDQ